MIDRTKLLASSVKSFGGQVKFGDAMGVSQQLVSYWIANNKLPAEKVLKAEGVFVEAGIEVDRHALRPDVFGERVVSNVAQSA